MKHLDDRIRHLLDEGMIALWLPADCEDAVIRTAIPLPWKIVWSEIDPDHLKTLLDEIPGRTHVVIDKKEDVPTSGNSSRVAFIYDVSVPARGQRSDVFRKRRRAEELENEMDGWSGLLVYAGSADQGTKQLEVIEALAPAASVLVNEPNAGSGCPQSPLAPMLWTGELTQLFQRTSEYLHERDKQGVLDLKEAAGVEVDADMVESIGDGWELLTRRHVRQPDSVTQDDFDAFLSGDATWEAISAGVAYHRGAFCRLRSDVDDRSEVRHDPIKYVIQRIEKLNQDEVDPSNSIEHIRIFAEPGSGTTTLLRQIGIEVAREGYPTLITTPYPRRLALEPIRDMVIHLQEAWAEARQDHGSGTGTLPVCLILDVDAELPAHFGKLMRGLLGDLHSKVVIVRAFRRSEQEIVHARGVLHLTAETSEAEILALGKHFRAFCRDRGLQRIPGDNEWRAFYEGFGRVHAYRSEMHRVDFETPPLFLIGLYPFVKDRVRDERSLEQYVYRIWKEIKDTSGRQLVEILATAGAHGIAVPFDSLARNSGLDTILLGGLDKADQRLVDFFCRWLKSGWKKHNWSLYIRHPALGLLLSRMLHTSEAEAPFSALLPVLKRLAGTEADHFFAEQIAYVLGRKFHRQSGAFSLEIDTAIQRAGRAIFQAFPDDLHNASRIICHHHARFHIHTLHACLGAIEDPQSTHLPEHAVRDLANSALIEATALLERARAIPDDRERVSNVLNTLAASIAQLAQAHAERGEDGEARYYFRDAVDRANEAVFQDVANGHALFNLINTILHKFEYNLVEHPREAMELFELVEDRLETLVRLHTNRQWRNASEDEADFTVANLVWRQRETARRLNVNPAIESFIVTSGVARVMLKLRDIVGASTLSASFRDTSRAQELRRLRDELHDIEGKSSRALLLLYKLYLRDPVGRLDFSTRLDLLSEIKCQSAEEYDPYRHDHAALSCLTGAFEAGSALFREISAARAADPERWFWVNERQLMEVREGSPVPKRHAVRVTDPLSGWGRISDTKIDVKFQPHQFPNLTAGEYVSAFIRFRLTGLQLVSDRMARFDLKAMDYDPRTVDWP